MNIYLLWGRVPGAHDDTTHIIAADDTQEAMTSVFNAHGTLIFINGCECIGELIEVNGETLIRPNPAMICGI